MRARRGVGGCALALGALAVLFGLSCGGEEFTDEQQHGQVSTSAALPTLDPTTIPQFVDPLVIPPAMPRTAVLKEKGPTCCNKKWPWGCGWWHPKCNKKIDYYEIVVKQFSQQILPTSLPQTTVWGYGSKYHPATFHSPSFTIEAEVDRPVRVKWINGLVDDQGHYLPHLFPVDQTLHWANPPGPRDSEGSDPTPYLGPVPIVTHLHGAHTRAISDGYPEAWYLPQAKDIPAGYFRFGTHYGSVLPAGPGAAIFDYPNDQRPTTLWYHDHSLGITRLNVYAGPAGFYLLRHRQLERWLDIPQRAPQLGDKPGTRYTEIPLAIQDRSFNADGSLFYPNSREFFDGFAGPYAPDSDVPPVWNPEFFGNTIMVNGKTWPYHEVEPRKYRLRLLNGCNSRFLVLRFEQQAPQPQLLFHQIGNSGGFLPATVALEQLLLAPAERADVIIDFSALAPGDEVILQNLGPDEPFGGFPVQPADPATTGKVMKFRMVPLKGQDKTSIPSWLPSAWPLGPEVRTRDLTLNERMSDLGDFPVMALLGSPEDGPLSWDGEDVFDEPAGTPYKNVSITENPGLYETEVWRLINLTADAHPIHLHLVMFEVLDRTPFDAEAYLAAQDAYLAGGKVGPAPDPVSFISGLPRPAEPGEAGTKDTVIAYPGELTRIKARFDLPGLYVWHCHILEHEDNEMMRPYYVGWLSGKPCWK